MHGERAVQMADGVRMTHAEVDLRGPFPLLVRGALVVVLDAAALALIWLLAEAIAGIPPAVPSWRRLRRSFRVRVAVALAVFFLIPAAGFAVWEVSRLNAEADHQRDEAITAVLRDVLAAASDPSLALSSSVGTLDRLAARFRAELAVYRGGGTPWRLRIRSWRRSPSSHPPDRARSGCRRSGARSSPPPTSRCWGRGVGSGYRIERPAAADQLVVLAAPRGGNGPGPP